MCSLYLEAVQGVPQVRNLVGSRGSKGNEGSKECQTREAPQGRAESPSPSCQVLSPALLLLSVIGLVVRTESPPCHSDLGISNLSLEMKGIRPGVVAYS